MIKVNRCECPPSLNKLDSEIVKSDYSADDVVDALYNMQHSKCCYCEKDMSLLGSTSRHVEHYIPKRFFEDNGETNWGQANSWENLLYSCSDCNSRKSGKYPFDEKRGQYIIINPSSRDIDPQQFIGFNIQGDYDVEHIGLDDSNVGYETIENLQFNTRKEIRRAIRTLRHGINGYFQEIYTAIEDNNAAKIRTVKGSLTQLMRADSPFSSFSRHYIALVLEEFNDNLIPRLREFTGRAIDCIALDSPIEAEVLQ